MTELTLDKDKAEKLIELLDKSDNLNQEIRTLVSEVFYYPSDPVKVREIRLTESDIPDEWFLKGMIPASPGAKWSFRFPKDQEGNIHPETELLVREIQEFSKVRIGRYEYSLSKDGQFLYRKIPREGKS
jgi:hypothetical protein